VLDSKVKLKVYRKGEDKLLEFKVKRNRVPITSVDASYKVTENIGYIKINRFSETTYAEFKKSLDVLKNKGITTLILDLRNNPGGYITPCREDRR
jgi:C-terminal processing peptidase-3. Serine peptidase. MEROPS family S41A